MNDVHLVDLAVYASLSDVDKLAYCAKLFVDQFVPRLVHTLGKEQVSPVLPLLSLTCIDGVRQQGREGWSEQALSQEGVVYLAKCRFFVL